MDKILFVGFGPETPYAIEYARELGVRTILADYLSAKDNPLKARVDEHWEVDVRDVDRLELLARESHVTAVFTGCSNEMCNDSALELCSRLGLPTLLSMEGWKATRDKLYFKQVAEESGLPTATTIHGGADDRVPDIPVEMYPVIVKPVDACASRGVRICRNADEVREAWECARAVSQTHRALIERYYSGEFVELEYVIHDGAASLLFQPRYFRPAGCGGDEAMQPISEIVDADTGWPSLVIAGFSGHPDGLVRWRNFEADMADRFVERLAMQEGVLLLQGIDCGDSVAFFEVGYRLDGDLLWKMAAEGGCMDVMKYLFDGAIARCTPQCEFDRRIDNAGFVGGFGIWAGAGTVCRIAGVDRVNAMEGLQVLATRLRPGMQIVEGPRTLESIAFLIGVQASDERQCMGRIRAAINALHVLDAHGTDLLIR